MEEVLEGSSKILSMVDVNELMMMEGRSEEKTHQVGGRGFCEGSKQI